MTSDSFSFTSFILISFDYMIVWYQNFTIIITFCFINGVLCEFFFIKIIAKITFFIEITGRDFKVQGFYCQSNVSHGRCKCNYVFIYILVFFSSYYTVNLTFIISNCAIHCIYDIWSFLTYSISCVHRCDEYTIYLFLSFNYNKQ